MLLRYCRLVCCHFILLILIPVLSLKASPEPTKLAGLGYSVVPSPREIDLTGKETEINSNWKIEARDLGADHIAVRFLKTDLKDWYGLKVEEGTATNKVIRLVVNKRAVSTGTRDELNRQGYVMKISPDMISIEGNSEQGLFYGVQTLVQLLKYSPGGRFLLPVGTIRDWPSGELRFLHWDTKHHQDRIETLKRYLDWSARFKVNMIGFELEDKFAYPSHPVIGAPGAFTPEELQEIVDYGLERYIQVVPVIQSPAHMNYVLKHPEFAHLRATCEYCGPEGMNYQVCLCDERSYELIFDMYQDIIDATKGVDYFHVSTDEVYYAGVCDKCKPPYKWEDLSTYSRDTRSLTWVEFAKRAYDFMKKNDRKMLAWVEYPLLAEDISKLPPGIINAVQRGTLEEEKKIGMKGLIYVSFQGVERLIPNYFSTVIEDMEDGSPVWSMDGGRLKSAYENLSYPGRDPSGKNTLAWDSDYPPLGAFGALWDDSGLHNETFWLGWATLAQYAWTPGMPSPEQHVADFMDIYYGPDVEGMVDIYRSIREQADFFERSWDDVEAPEERLYHGGYHEIIWKNPRTRTRWTLPQPALPKLFVAYSEVKVDPVYIGKYGKLVEEAKQLLYKNQLLKQKIHQNLNLADRNHYNLEVLLSLVEFTRHHNDMIISMKEIENTLQAAAQSNEPGRAMRNLISAYRLAGEMVRDREETFTYFTNIWEKSRYPMGRSVDGKEFYHVLDDVKDHWAYVRPDLSYHIAPEERIDMEGWMSQLAGIIREFGEKSGIPVEDFE
jgi:hexosaminidase